MDNITVTNPNTGEVLEYQASSPEEIMLSWREISESIKTLEQAKDKLKKLVPNILDERGQFELGNYAFKQSIVQRYNYDKSVMRKVLDLDTFDTLLEPAKTKVDRYLKENIDSLGEGSTLLRESMIPQGSSYSVIKLERIK